MSLHTWHGHSGDCPEVVESSTVICDGRIEHATDVCLSNREKNVIRGKEEANLISEVCFHYLIYFVHNDTFFVQYKVHMS
jgi:hypothetical protein